MEGVLYHLLPRGSGVQTDSNTSFGVSFCLLYAILAKGGVRIMLANCINASKAYCE